MSEQHPIVNGPNGAGPMEEGDLRQRLRTGQLPIDTLIQHPDWTDNRTLPARQVPELFCEVSSEHAIVAERLRQSKTPWCTVAVVVTLLIVFVAQQTEPTFQDWVAHRWILGWGSTVLDGHWYSPITAQFLHLSMSHFLINCAVICYCGLRVEHILRYKGLAQVLLMASAIGGLFVCLGSERPVVGSSIMGFGLWGAQVALGFRYSKSIPNTVRWHYGWGTFVIFASVQIIGLSSAQISHLGHLGGFLGGLILGIQGIRRLNGSVWVVSLLLFLTPTLGPWEKWQSWDHYERADLGVSFQHPSRLKSQSFPKIDVFSVHPVDTAYAFVSFWRVEVPPVSTEETVRAWWETQLEHPLTKFNTSTLEKGVRRFEMQMGPYHVVEHQHIKGLWVLRVGYWMHHSAYARTDQFERILSTIQWDLPSVLKNLSAQFDVLSAVPDVRYDYAVELSHWGEPLTADQVIEPLIWQKGEWGSRAARFRLALHRQYPKSFNHIDREWIEQVLELHGKPENDLYAQAILYAVAHHDCSLAMGWLAGVDEPQYRSDLFQKMSVYCSVEEE
ncbi:MAG: rhomboid family intramembrane serine protease [Myxococcota bacterium]